MSVFKRVLLLGTGPAAVQLAVMLKAALNCTVGIAGRESVRSESFYEAAQTHDRLMKVQVQNRSHAKLAGECHADHIYRGYEKVTGEWDTLVLSVTTDAYLEVLRQLEASVLLQIRRIVLISPTFGSGSLVRQFVKERHPIGAEVISFSTYLGDTRWMHGRPSNEVMTTGVKKKLYIGSTEADSEAVTELAGLFRQLGIQLEVTGSPLEAETRNISLYVHPALFMNDYSLDVIFRTEAAAAKRYVYKLYPEGPITQYLIRDDNYPVREESISLSDKEEFPRLAAIHQEYLLYIRYASLLIDPFSEPDREGRYFDFSAVPFRQIFINGSGEWDVPRMPAEDYYRIKIMQGIAGFIGLSCPTLDKFIEAYEQRLEAVPELLQGARRTAAFEVRGFQEDIAAICKDIETIQPI